MARARPPGPRESLGAGRQALVEEAIGPGTAGVSGRNERRKGQVVGRAHADDERASAPRQHEPAIGGGGGGLDVVRPFAGAIGAEH